MGDETTADGRGHGTKQMPYDDDAELVELLLHQNDGRMTLSELSPHFDCSAGNVSLVTRKMERDGRVKRLQYKGEVSVYLPGVYDETWGITDEPGYRPVRPPNAEPHPPNAETPRDTRDADEDETNDR